MKNVSKKMKLIQMIRNVICILLMIVPILILAFCLEVTIRFILVMILAIPYGLLSIFLLIYPSLSYKRYSYYYDEERICINYGVVFQHRIVVPVIQIQDIHLFAGPIMQIFKVTSLFVSTAGSTFSINFLLMEDAKKMVEDLQKYLKGRLEGGNDEEIL